MTALADGGVRPARPFGFFLIFPWVLLIAVVLCFGGKAIFDTADLPPITPMHHVHALSMGAWFVLLALQPTLIRLDRRDLHQKVGFLSIIVVLLFFASAAYISLLNWGRIGHTLVITANLMNMTLFAAYFVSAILLRRNAAWHKRLMVYASLSLMGPAFGRLPEIFDADPALAAPLVLGTAFAPLIHDMIVLKRPHPATLIGVAMVLISIPVMLGLGGSAEWHSVLEGVLGPSGP